jgi:spore germination protein GerM
MRRTGRILCLALVVPLLWSCGGGEQPAPETAAAEPGGEGEQQEPTGDPTLEPLTFRSVTVYFPSAYNEGLVGEPREIFETASPGDRAKQIISDILAGPDDPAALRAVPQGIRLRQVYVMDNGVAYADFSSELARRMGGGSMEEILAVYSIVNSLVLNVEEIDRVGFLMDGRPCESLNGHLDLRRPLPANLRLMNVRVDDGII